MTTRAKIIITLAAIALSFMAIAFLSGQCRANSTERIQAEQVTVRSSKVKASVALDDMASKLARAEEARTTAK